MLRLTAGKVTFKDIRMQEANQVYMDIHYEIELLDGDLFGCLSHAFDTTLHKFIVICGRGSLIGCKDILVRVKAKTEDGKVTKLITFYRRN